MNDIRGSVVVGIDGSRSAELAAGWAAVDGRGRNLPVHLVFSLGGVTPVLPGAYPMQCYYEGIDSNARERLDVAADVVRAAAPDIPITTAVTNQPPVLALVDLSEQADEVVLGQGDFRGFPELLLGSVATSVSTRARSPVVVVRGDPDATGPVVVGVDGGAAADVALAAAFERASRTGLPLVAAHAVEERHRASGGAGGAGEHVAEWRRRHPEVDLHWVEERGDPREVLLAQARRASVVVVGSRGRGGFRGLLLGSTSQALLHHAACPVMVVRART
ncbi:universal stress protein [Saccharopolyspora sp. NFXS83]|uniref:universal stress protein n=1 Tax=Saccharopolyspora sp. NFXS83 TaxID=2993560 RepID=UPI00224A9770|nr:universal stress protein [Saccharopolyspora sp. NFXS83]MCX2729389.1 universal stress protein [Saccharopolyspora sp. NFXS83]